MQYGVGGGSRGQSPLVKKKTVPEKVKSSSRNSFQKIQENVNSGKCASGKRRSARLTSLLFLTANFNDDVVEKLPSEVTTGIYFGWSKLASEQVVRKAVISIGWNPYYKNVKKSVVRLNELISFSFANGACLTHEK